LVQQGLKQMMIRTIDQRDVNGLARQAPRDRKPAKAAADDHHAPP
jgi:hypothetical protein